MKKRKAHTTPFSRLIALVVIGMGLIAVGIAAMAFVTMNRAAPESDVSGGSGSDASVLPALVNYPAPELTLTDLNGQSYSLADYRGRVALVNMWATWCPPCRQEMPTLQSFYEQYADLGFVIIAIDDGDPAPDVAAFVEEYGLTFPVWLDPQYASERAFNTMNLPSSFVMDREGIIRLQWVGAIERDQLETYVAPVILE
ncbi:MAG: TlpA family protein disulfide reductase [Chloroflexota bacterium]